MNTLSAVFETLPTPDRLQESAAYRADLTPRLPVNAHIHLPPNFSAFDTVAQAVELAATQQIAVLGVNNYYDYTIYNEFAVQAKSRGIIPLFGTEIITLSDELRQAGIKVNDPGNPGKMYLCGKGITQFAPLSHEALRLLDTIRQRDAERMALVIFRLVEIFGEVGIETGLDEATIKAQIVAQQGVPVETVYLQERHIAQAFQEAVFAQTEGTRRADLLHLLFGTRVESDSANAVQNAIRAHLMKAGKPAYVAETFVGLEHAVQLIRALGGVVCYPVLADGANPLCGFESSPAVLVEKLQAHHIHCAEFIPIRNSPEVLSEYVTALREAGVLVTAGTEHNTRDLIPLAPTCLKGAPIPEPVQEIFWEGTCVLVAHQYLTIQNQPGFYERPLAELAKIGAEVIKAYRTNRTSPP
jgi:hypothetical protein